MIATGSTVLALRIAELEAENVALKESNEYAWRNARTIDAARMETEKQLLTAQHCIKELREELERACAGKTPNAELTGASGAFAAKRPR